MSTKIMMILINATIKHHNLVDFSICGVEELVQSGRHPYCLCSFPLHYLHMIEQCLGVLLEFLDTWVLVDPAPLSLETKEFLKRVLCHATTEKWWGTWDSQQDLSQLNETLNCGSK